MNTNRTSAAIGDMTQQFGGHSNFLGFRNAIFPLSADRDRPRGMFDPVVSDVEVQYPAHHSRPFSIRRTQHVDNPH